ncbi:MAG: polyribonucleotide nucleotidyltransferase, partial [Gammaproteobacteria bacterium]|nr:polyribonucleotide nucleotidyltransferase [Gammaproteobacteria bacterium]
MTPIRKTFKFGDHTVELETGAIARQADGAVKVSMGDTVILVTAVGMQDDQGGRGFLPLTVNYQEKTYAAGRIPGGFFRREGRPSEFETLTSRLIDRPLRPLFPKGFENEVQVIATVMSLNPDIPADIPALIGASAAMAISGIPFNGPLAGARVAYVDDNFVLNPTRSQLAQSRLDLVVAGTKNAVLMVESEAQVLPESVMLDAVMFGHEGMQAAIKTIQELADEAGKATWDWQAPEEDQALTKAVSDAAKDQVTTAYTTPDKTARREQLQDIKATVVDSLASDDESSDEGWSASDISSAVSKLEKTVVRDRILSGEKRIDGRDTTTVRNLDVQLGVLPRTHGSSMFTRGETQA